MQEYHCSKLMLERNKGQCILYTLKLYKVIHQKSNLVLTGEIMLNSKNCLRSSHLTLTLRVDSRANYHWLANIREMRESCVFFFKS